jgi:lipopolysaccharide biosynthesis glycosyltransferase
MNSACVFCIDDAYLMPFQVFFHSLDATGSIPANTSLFILHTATLSSESIDLLHAFLGTYGRSASFVDATSLIPEELPICPGDHVSPATFYRLFIAEILPAEIEQAIYLDADMLALRSIANIFDEPVKELVAAADHCRPADEIRLWGERGGTYFQAGVLVIPLQTWRELGILDRFLHVMANEQERIQWWDQDVLNIALQDRWQRLPIWCNVCEAVHRNLDQRLIEENGAVIHFSGSAKPWNCLNSSPFTEHWDQVYFDLFGEPFNRTQFLPPQPPPTSRRDRMKVALRSRLSGLIHGRS